MCLFNMHHDPPLSCFAGWIPRPPAAAGWGPGPTDCRNHKTLPLLWTYPILGGLTALLEPAIPPCSTWVSAMFKGRLLQPFAQMKAGIGVKKATGRFGWPNPSQSLPGGTSDGQRLT